MIESIQYYSAIAITGEIRGTSSEKLYQELGLESLGSRGSLRKLALFYKIYHLLFLYNLIPERFNFYSIWAVKSIYPISKPGVTFSEILFLLLQ